VLAGLEGGQGLWGVVGDGRVDVDGIDGRVLQQLVVVGVAGLDAELVPDLVEALLVATADGGHLGVGVGLVDGNELGAETKADDGDANLPVGRHVVVPFVVRPGVVSLKNMPGRGAWQEGRRKSGRIFRRIVADWTPWWTRLAFSVTLQL